MATLKKYDLSGKEVGTVTLDDAFVEKEPNQQSVKDYIVALRRNARQWSASTKGRSEVSHSTKKPHRQKGTGSARQGSLAAPQYRGGGIVFGPKPKFDQFVRINRKERRQAIRALIGEKVKGDALVILDDKAFSGLEKPSAKAVGTFLKGRSVYGRPILFVGEGAFEKVETAGKEQKVSVKSDHHRNFKLSMRNVPRAAFSQATNLNGYDVLAAREVVMSESALKELQELLKV